MAVRKEWAFYANLGGTAGVYALVPEFRGKGFFVTFLSFWMEGVGSYDGRLVAN